MGKHWLLGFIKPRWCDIQRREAELNIAPPRFNKSNNQCLPIEYMCYCMPYRVSQIKLPSQYIFKYISIQIINQPAGF